MARRSFEQDQGELVLPPDTVGLLEGIATTRAIRHYLDEPIPTEALATILFAATRAPSGSNRQPTRFLVLTDGERAVAAKALIGSNARAGWAIKESTDGYVESVAADPTSPKARMSKAMERYVREFESVPVVILVCMVRYRGAYALEGGSVYPACQNLLLAARALGYGGVLTSWHTGVDAELHELLGIPEEVPIVGTITLGRPKGKHGPVRRLPIGEVVYENGWGERAAWATDPEGTKHTKAGPRVTNTQA